MKALKPIVLAVIILATSAAFCIACTGINSEKEKEDTAIHTVGIDVEYGSDDGEENKEEIEVEDIFFEYDSYEYEPEHEEEYTEKSTEREKTEKTERTTERETTEKQTERETTAKPETQPEESPTLYDKEDIKQSLINGCWQIVLCDGSLANCKFYANGTFSIYDGDGNFVESGYYVLDGYGICLMDAEGCILMYLEYNPEEESFGDTSATTAPATSEEPELNAYNVQEMLEDAVECYDRCVNTTTFGFETSYSDGITCPHCLEEGTDGLEGYELAWLVTNYDSREDIEQYIDTYLYGNAREEALIYLNDLFYYGFLTESDGNLYLCPLYNERGYTPLDPDTMKYLGQTTDGKHRIEISDGDFTYRLDFIYIDGRFKVCDIIY